MVVPPCARSHVSKLVCFFLAADPRPDRLARSCAGGADDRSHAQPARFKCFLVRALALLVQFERQRARRPMRVRVPVLGHARGQCSAALLSRSVLSPLLVHLDHRPTVYLVPMGCFIARSWVPGPFRRRALAGLGLSAAAVSPDV